MCDVNGMSKTKLFGTYWYYCFFRAVKVSGSRDKARSHETHDLVVLTSKADFCASKPSRLIKQEFGAED